MIIMSLNGGLWFAVSNFVLSSVAHSMLLVFAGLLSLASSC